MYLKRLELQGFKSFANRTVLEFKQGITAVIGPNGSGKSNIVDAIRWVLGEQSMKSLRGTKSEDIIFAGTQNRKSLGFAEVSMVIDNSDQSLPIEYAEVTVTRRIYRTGESGYFINKVPCRLKDINELFMDTGIGKDGYSIIGQGRIDEILSNKSEDRRKIFEEAAGIVKYRTRRDETEKKLEQTRLNLVRINDILSEIEANIEPLREQSDKAKKYLELKEKLKNIEVGLYLYKIDSFKSKLEELIKNKEILEKQNKDESTKLDGMQELKEKLKEELATINEQIEKIQSLGFESKNKIEQINSNISISNERITNNIANKNRLENEITQATQNIAELEEEKKNRELRKENLAKNRERFEKELREKEEELAKLSKKLSSKEIEIEDKKKQTEILTEKKYNYQNQLTMIDTNVENYQARIKQIEKELDKLISELDERRSTKNEISSEKNLTENTLNANKSELEKVQKEKEKLDKDTQKYEEIINKLTDEKRLKTSKYNFLVETEKEKEGYVKSVKDILKACDNDKELKKGIEGVLANIISTKSEYQTAIEMALGASMQNIVTDTEADAKKLIEYLRKNNLGRASFLPVATIKGKKIEKVKELDGFVGIASDLVKANSKYENIILNLLGRTAIVDNIENAIKIAKENKYSFKIVTLEGDIINPSGAMTGGSVAKKTLNILGRAAEIKKLEKDIESIDKKLENAVTEKENFIESNKDLLEKIEEVNNNLQQSEISFAAISERYNAIETEINKIVASKEKLTVEIQTLKDRIANTDNEKNETRKSIDDINATILNLQNEIEEFAKLNKDDQEYIDNLNTDITDLKISVSSFDESNTSIEEMMERIEGDIKAENNRILNNKAEIEKSEKQNVELKATIEDLQQSIEKIKADVENSGIKTQELKEKRDQKNQKIDLTEKEISKQFETIQSVKEGLVKVDAKQTSVNQDLEDTVNDLWNDYEITPNNAKENFEKPTNITETQKNVNEIHAKIRNLGVVNVNAIDEYKKTFARYEEMSTQRLDLENTIAKLRKVIDEMTEAMKKQFKEKFNKIQKNFNEVFVELFGGGKAELLLEDENNVLECGIDIKVQPTGKKLQNMMLLSGGEKALTAIALLFAILKINPAPFCILDEIEAALDDVNVYRYAEFLKKFSKETEFLVITHRKGSMEAANTVYGITMEENGVSKLLSINLEK